MPNLLEDEESILPEEEEQSLLDPTFRPTQPSEERGLLGDVSTALGRGVGRAVEMTGRGLKVAGLETVGTGIQEAGEAVAESEMLAPDAAALSGEEGFVKRSLISAAESIPQSLAVLGAAGVGALAAPLVGASATVGASVMGAATLINNFAFGTYDQTKEQALKDLPTARPELNQEQIDQEAHNFGVHQALWETIPEALSDVVAAATFGTGKILFGMGKAGVKTTLNQALSQGPKAFAKQFGKAYMQSMPVEAVSEMITYYGQSTGEQDIGIGPGPKIQGFLDAAGAAAWMTGALGVSIQGYNQSVRNRIVTNLNSQNELVQTRAVDQAAAAISKQLGPEAAQRWTESAKQTINNDQVIDLSAEIMKFAEAQKDVQSETGMPTEPEGILTRALSRGGESVTAGAGTVSAEEIQKMEMENIVAGKKAAGIPLTPEETAATEYAQYQPEAPPSRAGIVQGAIKAGEEQAPKTKVSTRATDIVARLRRPEIEKQAEAFAKEAAEYNRLKNISSPTPAQKARLVELTGDQEAAEAATEKRTRELEKDREAKKFEQEIKTADIVAQSEAEAVDIAAAPKRKRKPTFVPRGQLSAVQSLRTFSEVPLTGALTDAEKRVRDKRVKAEKRADIRTAFADYDQTKQDKAIFAVREGNDVATAIPVMMRDLAEGQAGRRLRKPDDSKTYDAEAGETFAEPSSFPLWVKENSKVSKAGRRGIERVVKLALTGKKMTTNQQEIWKELRSIAKEQAATHPDLIAGGAYDLLKEEGFEFKDEAVIAGDLKSGDELVVLDKLGTPTKLTYKGLDVKGNIVFSGQGVSISTDQFGKIEVLAKKIAEPGIVEDIKRFLSDLSHNENPQNIREMLVSIPEVMKQKEELRPYRDLIQSALENRLVDIQGKIVIKTADGVHTKTAEVAREWLSSFEASALRPVNIQILTKSELLDGMQTKTLPEEMIDFLKEKPKVLASKATPGFAWNDGKGNYIIVSKGVTSKNDFENAKRLTTLAHEVGHVIQKEFFESSPDNVKKEIVEAYEVWKEKTAKTVRGGEAASAQRLPIAIHQPIAGKERDDTIKRKTTPTGKSYEDYLLSFNEWFANETAKALTTNKTPVDTVGKFFADLANVLRGFAKQILGTAYVPDKAIADFILGGDTMLSSVDKNNPGIDLFIDPDTGTGSVSTYSPETDRLMKEASKKPSRENYKSWFNKEGQETTKNYSIRKTKAMARDAAQSLDKYLGSISTRIHKYSPELAEKLRRMEFHIGVRINRFAKDVQPLLKKAKNLMTKEDYSNWQYARYNSDSAMLDKLVEKYNLESEYKAVRKVLSNIKSDLVAAGYDVGQIEEYWPRSVKDTNGLLETMDRGSMRPIFSEALRSRAKEMGLQSVSELSTEDRASVANNLILGKRYGVPGPSAVKERVFRKIPPELMQYYLDPDAALLAHIREATKSVEYRRFFGKVGEKMKVIREKLVIAEQTSLKPDITEARLKELEGMIVEYKTMLARNDTGDFSKHIGMFVGDLIQKGKLSPEGEQTVKDTLTARFHEHGAQGVFRAYKNLSLIDTMGSFSSAITQIGDFAGSLYNAGFFQTGKALKDALTGKQRTTQEELGVEAIAEEFSDPGALGKAVNNLFKITGLNAMNKIARNTFLNAAYSQFKSEAKNDSAALKKKIRPIFGAETDSVIQDLLNDDVTDNVRLMVFSRLLDFQPVTKSEMPEGYLLAGNGRLFYSLKSYTIKQLDMFRKESITKMQSNEKPVRIEGFQNLLKLSFFLVLANATADEIKDYIMGREVDTQDRVIDNALRLLGISRFITWQARKEGIGSAIGKQILPPFKFLDSMTKDIITAGDDEGLMMLDSLPVVGKLAYWRMGRGAKTKRDIWSIRWGKKKEKISKFNGRLERAENKQLFISSNRVDYRDSLRFKKANEKVNKYKRQINKLESLPSSSKNENFIDKTDKQRAKVIKEFLGR